MNKLLKYYSFLLGNKIEKIQKYFTEELKNSENLTFKNIDICFTPSHTAIMNLNFISKKDSESLKFLKLENDHLINLIKIIYILLNLNFDSVKREELLLNLFNKIFKNYNIDHISKHNKFKNLELLFTQIICHNLLLSNNQIFQINDIIQKDKNVFEFSTISKLSKPLSSLTFILKEMIEFSTLTNNNGVLICQLRKQKIHLIKLVEEMEKINEILIHLKD